MAKAYFPIFFLTCMNIFIVFVVPFILGILVFRLLFMCKRQTKEYSDPSVKKTKNRGEKSKITAKAKKKHNQQFYQLSNNQSIRQSLPHLNAVPWSHVCDVVEVRGRADHLTPSVCGPVMEAVTSQENQDKGTTKETLTIKTHKEGFSNKN